MRKFTLFARIIGHAVSLEREGLRVPITKNYLLLHRLLIDFSFRPLFRKQAASDREQEAFTWTGQTCASCCHGKIWRSWALVAGQVCPCDPCRCCKSSSGSNILRSSLNTEVQNAECLLVALVVWVRLLLRPRSSVLVLLMKVAGCRQRHG